MIRQGNSIETPKAEPRPKSNKTTAQWVNGKLTHAKPLNCKCKIETGEQLAGTLFYALHRSHQLQQKFGCQELSLR